MTQFAIQVNNLAKTFRQGFFRKKVHALRDVSFQVPEASVFGFLGPNGAGKTTTIKILTGLIVASSGSATVLNCPVPNPKGREKLGFLPENPYVYPYLTPVEFVRMCARLSGVPRQLLDTKTTRALQRVDIAYAANRPIARLSKGMLQRTCLAAALVHEPQLLILDEPMSGLDPVGRKQVRDVILEERRAGRTVFFSSHILSDVESMCDQVVILREGKVVVQGNINALLEHRNLHTDIVLGGDQTALSNIVQQLKNNENSTETEHAPHTQPVQIEIMADVVRIVVQGDDSVRWVLSIALQHHARVIEVTSRRETLEHLFVKKAFGE